MMPSTQPISHWPMSGNRTMERNHGYRGRRALGDLQVVAVTLALHVVPTYVLNIVLWEVLPMRDVQGASLYRYVRMFQPFVNFLTYG